MKRRFFFHFNKHTGKMTVHFKKACIAVDDVICTAPCESKWNDTQPRLVMRGWATKVEVVDGKAHIYA